MRRLIALWFFVAISTGFATAEASDAIRIGHFPNITHAQPLVGKALGTFDRKLKAKIDWKVFNAGPSAMEALLAGQLDIAYVGPNPAVNAFLRSKGKALQIIAGAASGGASLVVPKTSPVRSARDFRGKRIASPELGNTQDVALRHWLKESGLVPGRDVQVTPIKNPDILMLFQQGKLDGAWVPEPWVSRLLSEGGGRILLDERTLWPGGKFPTAVVVVRRAFLEKNRVLVRQFLDAHVEVSAWIGKHPEAARNKLNEQLARIVGRPFPPQTLADASSRVLVTVDPLGGALITSARWAQSLQYLPRNADLDTDLGQLIDVSLLNEALKAKSMPMVKGK